MTKINLRSWKVVDQAYGELQFIIIADPNCYSQNKLNMLIQNGMKCVVIDERSSLVNSMFVDLDTK